MFGKSKNNERKTLMTCVAYKLSHHSSNYYAFLQESRGYRQLFDQKIVKMTKSFGQWKKAYVSGW